MYTIGPDHMHIPTSIMQPFPQIGGCFFQTHYTLIYGSCAIQNSQESYVLYSTDAIYGMSITIIEDLLKPNQFGYASQRLTDIAIDWFYLPFTANLNDVASEDPKYQGSFSHLIYKDEQNISPLWDPSLMILLAALDHQGQELESVLRVRLGLCTRTPWPVEHSPHIDHPVLNHRTGIFYPADSDGDTVVFDQRREQARREDYTVWHRQRPRANLWMDFPGRHFHSSTTPVAHESRYVLTINYVVKEDKKR